MHNRKRIIESAYYIMPKKYMNIVKLTKSNIPFAGIAANININSIKKLPVIDINSFINTDIPLYVYEFSYYLNNIYNDEDDEEVAILKIVMSDNGNYKCLHIYCREESISLKEVKEKYLNLDIDKLP